MFIIAMKDMLQDGIGNAENTNVPVKSVLLEPSHMMEIMYLFGKDNTIIKSLNKKKSFYGQFLATLSLSLTTFVHCIKCIILEFSFGIESSTEKTLIN